MKNEDADENRRAIKTRSADGAENPAAKTLLMSRIGGRERDTARLTRQVICYLGREDRATRRNRARARASRGAILRQMAVGVEVVGRRS